MVLAVGSSLANLRRNRGNWRSHPVEQTPHQKAMADLDRQIEALLRKKSALAKAELPAIAALRKSALLANERPTRKSRNKLEIMGRVIALLKRHPEGRSGMTSASLHKHLRAERPDLTFDALRSYLSRFKKEGRLVHDPEHQLWRLPTQT